MATVIPIGEPVNEAKRQAIAYQRDHLPSGYLVLPNFELFRDGKPSVVNVTVSTVGCVDPEVHRVRDALRARFAAEGA